MASNAASVAKPKSGDDNGQKSAAREGTAGAATTPPVSQTPAPSTPAAADTKAHTEQPSPYELRDLKAQEDMVYWAMWMFVAALLTFIVTSVGTFLIWRQVRLTRQAVEDTSEATEAMREANRIATDTATRQLRAYVSIGTIDIPMPQVGQPISLTTNMVNTGQTPAFKLGISQRLIVGTPPFPPETETLVEPESSGVLGPNNPGHARLVASWPMTADMLAQIRSGAVQVIVHGLITYEDLFQNPRKTRFRYKLAFHPSAHNFEACATGNEAD